MNKILIVDDSSLMLLAAQNMILAHQELQADVKTCKNGMEALELIASTPFDIMLLDIMMPQMDGLEVLKALQAYENKAYLKILMFSSITDKKALRECFSLGATDFITKPIDEDEFIARISSALQEQNLKKQFRETIELMHQQNIQLSSLNRQLAETEQQLIQQEQMAGVGYLAAGIAHEINNPIGYIKSNLSSLHGYLLDLLYRLNRYEEKYGKLPVNEEKMVLETDFIKEDGQILYDETRQGILKIETIVNSLRSFSIIDNANALVEVHVSKVLEDILILLASEILPTVQIDKHYAPIEPLLLNGGEIHLAFLNLIKNALYAVNNDAKPLKHISLHVEEDDHFVYCRIRDNGMGISPSNLTSIFNPFFTTKPLGEGTGLGLSMAYSVIVTKHGGKLEVSSEEGQWTEFFIALPKQ